ncbi:sterol regulatory element-binding protein 1 isoform X2 [Culicoides brevitarsis]|uniref:sterol regulatory element-binding protein 1 isoform X2 n=1 Tax=Culicoides brevitarsis TaxID=469753 RepID=UPI00307C7153
MDRLSWEPFDNKMELETNFHGAESAFDVNEIADDMFRINDDKLIGMVGDDFLTQFGLDVDLVNTEISQSNDISTLDQADDLKVLQSDEIKFSNFLEDTSASKTFDDADEMNIKDKKNPVSILQDTKSTALHHSTIILPINTISNMMSHQSNTMTQVPHIKSVQSRLDSTNVQQTSQLLAIQGFPTVMCKYTEGNGAIQPQNIHVVNAGTILTGIPVVFDTKENSESKSERNNVKPNKEGKRSAHNAIERRYRTSINSCICELKKKLGAGNLTPPRSCDESNPSLSPQYSEPSSPYSSDESGTYNGMASHSKLTLCMFMFAMLVINPFKALLKEEETLNSDYTTARRTILESNEYSFTSWTQYGSTLSLWTINILIFVFCLLKILFFADPYIKQGSRMSKILEQRIKIAENQFKCTKNMENTFEKFVLCLNCFGIRLPKTGFDRYVSMTWQLVRLFLYETLGKWISKIYIFNSRADNLYSAKELAYINHRLNQIALTLNMDKQIRLLTSLHAINMIERSITNAELDLIVEIYLSAALSAKGTFFNIISRYCLWKAKHYLSLTKKHSPYEWTVTSHGYRFLSTYECENISLMPKVTNIFTSTKNYANPLQYVLTKYREFLLEKSLKSLVGFTNYKQEGLKKQFERVLFFTNLYKESISIGDVESLGDWWCNLFEISAYWSLAEDKKAYDLYLNLRNIPAVLLEDTLYRSFIASFRAKCEINSPDGFDGINIMKYCNIGSKLLKETLDDSKITGSRKLLQYLICDWLLEIRWSLYEIEKNQQLQHDQCTSVPLDVLSYFQNDLNSLRTIVLDMPVLQSRLYVYEASERILACASPNFTQQLLDRSVRQRTNNRTSIICGNRSSANGNDLTKATALYLACKHLPAVCLSAPGERAGMLECAAKSLEKIGDKKRLNECYKLMKSISNGITTFT